MKNILVTIVALFTGLLALFTSLILAIPLSIAALITGKRIQNQMKKQGFAAHMNTRQSSTNDAGVIEGEYEDLSSRK
ncbi:hypothetical protein CSB62_16145 [Vibrio splendidus]|uniref:Hydroxylamine reductase n=1 Tax=Vibrio lentus TaxID=136468 RepID=A0A4V5RBI3_9VIBR|nr:hypothetical protein [Vibrio lentus]PHN85056.1 hypothetical protein CSB62_16145 [Vibrio splendidus]PMI93362.1 hypothetical protein BCU33_07420 [Vibrio lentus]PML03430.1 hypothetical protein BCT85_09365 [Vibrio lentus]TKF55148.1 hypothetical protein FCV63_15065 [Vibrio lentus]TKF99095.1 hypothetical protein FCV71_02170 [Vibrio lentus]